MSICPEPSFRPGSEIAGHLVIEQIGTANHRGARLMARDARGRGNDVAILVEPHVDDAAVASARHHAQRLASIGHRGLCVPTDIVRTDRGLATLRPWFPATLGEGPDSLDIPALRRVEMLIELAGALAAAHAVGVRHGAVSAQNIAVADGGRAVLIDARPESHSSTKDDVRCLGALGMDWLSSHRSSVQIDRTWKRCEEAARSGGDAARLAEDLSTILSEVEDPTPSGLPAVSPAETASTFIGHRGAPLLAAVVLVVVAVAGTLLVRDSGDSSDEVTAAENTLGPCEDAYEPEVTPGVENLWADTDGVGCGIAVSWTSTRAEVEVHEGTAAGHYRLGERGDRFLVGDWDGDGHDYPGLYRPITGEVFLWSGWPSDGAAMPSSITHGSGVVGGEPHVVDHGSRQQIEVAQGTET